MKLKHALTAIILTIASAAAAHAETSPQIDTHDMSMVEQLANKITDENKGFVGWGVNLYVTTADPRVARSVANTMCHQLASKLDAQWNVRVYMTPSDRLGAECDIPPATGIIDPEQK